MQFIVCKIAWIMQFSMGTTAIESLNAATNIFIGMVRLTSFHMCAFCLDSFLRDTSVNDELSCLFLKV